MIQEDKGELEKKLAGVVVKVDGAAAEEASDEDEQNESPEPQSGNIMAVNTKIYDPADERYFLDDFLKRHGTSGRYALQIRQYVLNWASQGGRTIPQMVTYIKKNEMPEIIQKAFEYASERTIELLKSGEICQPPPELMKAIFRKYQSISDKFEKNRVEV